MDVDGGNRRSGRHFRGLLVGASFLESVSIS